MIALTHILVATDFGEAADAALVYGRALATGSGASLDVLHVVDNPFLHASLADPQRQLNRRLTDEDHRTLHVRAVVEISDVPAEVIVEHFRAFAMSKIDEEEAALALASLQLMGQAYATAFGAAIRVGTDVWAGRYGVYGDAPGRSSRADNSERLATPSLR